MTWRQPIPIKIDGISKKEETVMKRLIERCRNTQGYAKVGDLEVKLDRGQCIIGRFEFAEEFLLKRNESMRVQRIVDKLEKTSKLITKKRHRDCTIITILNYDSYIDMKDTNEQTVSKQ